MMCIAIPGKIVRIKDSVATIDYGSEKRTAKIFDGSFQPGDFVIVKEGIF